jgi:ABC-type Zn uptake system ZnuABC Zn-binding protein ZnuA
MPEKKRSFQKLLLTALFLLAVTLGTTTGVQAKENPGSLTVYTVNYPLQYFAQRIAGHDAKVVFPAPAKGDPAFWTPDAQAVAEFQQADLILLNGANYAKWLGRVSLPRFRLVDTSAGFKDNYIVTTAGGVPQPRPWRRARPRRHGIHDLAGLLTGGGAGKGGDAGAEPQAAAACGTV